MKHKLKKHEWCSLYPKDQHISTCHFLGVIKSAYNLDGNIGNDLVLVVCWRVKCMKITSDNDNHPNMGGRAMRHEKDNGLLAT